VDTWVHIVNLNPGNKQHVYIRQPKVPLNKISAQIACEHINRCISNTPGACTTFVPFVSPAPFNLAAGDGPKTVFVFLRDAANNTSPNPGTASTQLDAKSGLLSATVATTNTKTISVQVTANAAQM
jgi:hypothetical protein